MGAAYDLSEFVKNDPRWKDGSGYYPTMMKLGNFNILANLIDALEGEHRGIALSDAGQSALRELFIIRERRLKPHFNVG